MNSFPQKNIQSWLLLQVICSRGSMDIMKPSGHSRSALWNPLDIPGMRNEQSLLLLKSNSSRHYGIHGQAFQDWLWNPVHIPGVRNQQLSTPQKGIQSCSGSVSGLAAAVAGSQLHEFSTLRFFDF
jgi:hypothetical protein